MKELLLQYAQYNVWANKRVTDAMHKLDDRAEDKEIPSSFPSLRTTVYHTWSAEYIWLQRLQHTEHTVWIESEFNGTFAEACREWLLVSGALIHFTEQQPDDKALVHLLRFHDRSKVSYKMPVFQVLQHVFNHSTYHRGQMVTMLRQAGVKEIPQMDFILFARKKG